MNLAGLILKAFGWKVEITVPDVPKCIICVAPHTSNWDFILGKLAYRAVGRRAGFLMKESWFFWPLGPIFRAIGGIPVPRRRKDSTRHLTEIVAEKIIEAPGHIHIAVTPEGTRSRTAHWRTGFLTIARLADVPIMLGALDFKTRRIQICDEFFPTGDTERDMRAIKDFYAPFEGKFPEKFTTEDAD